MPCVLFIAPGPEPCRRIYGGFGFSYLNIERFAGLLTTAFPRFRQEYLRSPVPRRASAPVRHLFPPTPARPAAGGPRRVGHHGLLYGCRVTVLR